MRFCSDLKITVIVNVLTDNTLFFNFRVFTPRFILTFMFSSSIIILVIKLSLNISLFWSLIFLLLPSKDCTTLFCSQFSLTPGRDRFFLFSWLWWCLASTCSLQLQAALNLPHILYLQLVIQHLTIKVSRYHLFPIQMPLSIFGLTNYSIALSSILFRKQELSTDIFDLI